MEGLGIGGAVFFLKTPKRAIKQIPQIFYHKGQTVLIEPNTPKWNELMGRFKLSEFFTSPELWEAAQSIKELKEQLFKDKDRIHVAVRRDVEGYGDMIMTTVIPRAFKEAFGDDVDVTIFTRPELGELLKGNSDLKAVKFDMTEYSDGDYDLKLNANNIDFKAETKETELREGVRKNRTNIYLQQLGLWLIDRTPIYVVSEEEKIWAKSIFRDLPRPIIAVQRDASVKAKTYPHIKKVVQTLREKEYTVAELDDTLENGNYLFTLREMAALINEADIIVAPDSFALHVAGALGKRGVGLFGYTDGKVIAQDYHKINSLQAHCPRKKNPCWWSIDCLPGASTREKEVAGNCECLKELTPQTVLHWIEKAREDWERPPVFLAVLTYNLLNMTKKAIASIKSQHAYELLVVDNNSDDGTQEWLKEKGIKFISKKSSVAEAQNIAMKEFLKTDSQYFIFLNNDIVLRADYIDELIDAQKRTGAWGIVGELIKATPAWAVDDKKITERWDKECTDIPAGSYSATLLTRECIEKVGLFDEQYTPRYIEDNDYTLRIRLAGGKFYLTSYAQFFHALGAVIHNMPEEAKRNNERWKKNINKFKTKFGIDPHEAQDLKKLGLEWYRAIYKKYPIALMDELQTALNKSKVLIQRNMGGFGDIIFTTILAKILKERYEENIVIDYAVPKKFMQVLKFNPNIDEIYEYGHPYGAYDFVVELTDLEYRVELNEIQKYGEIITPRTKIYLDVMGIEESVFRARLKPDYFISDDEKYWAEKWWGKERLRVGVIQRGSNMLKVWPGMNELISKLTGRVVVLDKLGLGFRKVGALVGAADYIISPDTGISNLAGAVGTPVITIFGNRNGAVFKKMFDTMIPIQGNCPISHLHKDYCDFQTPCFGDAPHRVKENIDVPGCLKNLSVDEVYEKVKVLQELLLGRQGEVTV